MKIIVNISSCSWSFLFFLLKPIKKFHQKWRRILYHRNRWHYSNHRNIQERKISLKEVAEHIVIDVSILRKIEYGDQPNLKESLEKYLEAK